MRKGRTTSMHHMAPSIGQWAIGWHVQTGPLAPPLTTLYFILPIEFCPLPSPKRQKKKSSDKKEKAMHGWWVDSSSYFAPFNSPFFSPNAIALDHFTNICLLSTLVILILTLGRKHAKFHIVYRLLINTERKEGNIGRKRSRSCMHDEGEERKN